MDIRKRRFFSIISCEDLDDFEFLDEELDKSLNSHSIIQTTDTTEILLTIANFDTKSSLSTIAKILEDNDHLSDLNKYVEAVCFSMRDTFGDTVADLIMMSLQNSDECTTIEESKVFIFENAEIFFSLASSFCHAISSDFKKSQGVPKIASMINAISMTIPKAIYYRPIPALSKSTGNIAFFDSFSTDNTSYALYLCFVFSFREKKQIRTCKVCRKYFIPSFKSNEIYCKNCRKTTYDTKIKQDEILNAYRTIYKTQNARKQRNSHRPNIEEKFEKWKEYARLNLQKCKNHEITLDEMREAISSDGWINDTL